MTEIRLRRTDSATVAEFIGEGVLLRSAGDARDMLFEASGKGADWLALHEANVAPAFFDLRTGLAGEVLQTFANYRFKFAVIGDISRYTEKSEALAALVRESNRGRGVRFSPTLELLLERI